MNKHVDTPDIEVDPLPRCFHVRMSWDIETHEMECLTCGQVFVPASERDDLQKFADREHQDLEALKKTVSDAYCEAFSLAWYPHRFVDGPALMLEEIKKLRVQLYSPIIPIRDGLDEGGK